MPKRLNLIGKIFDRWVVVSMTDKRDIGGNVIWKCRCNCGNDGLVSATSLKSGKSRSCGCFQVESAKNLKTHGLSNTIEYDAWMNMRKRCSDINGAYYSYYGGRGIRVCDRWLNSFQNFLFDMGPRPSKDHSLDRYPDVNGNYEPNNCRWGTQKEQARCKRSNVWFEYNGEKMIMSDWVKRLGVNPGSIRYQIGIRKSFSEVVKYFEQKRIASDANTN